MLRRKQLNEFELIESLRIQVTVRHRFEGHLFRFAVVGATAGGPGRLRCRNYRNGPGPQSAMTFLSEALVFATRQAELSGLI